MPRFRFHLTVEFDGDDDHMARAIQEQVAAVVFGLPDVLTVEGHPLLDITDGYDPEVQYFALGEQAQDAVMEDAVGGLSAGFRGIWDR